MDMKKLMSALMLVFASGSIALFAVLFIYENRTLKKEIAELKTSLDQAKPGLGEIMGTIHIHHAKLYYSATKDNWDLAAYQLDEIKEGLDQATELHDEFKTVKTPLSVLKHMTDQGLSEVDSAIKARNKPAFLMAYQHLTQSCNQCHQAADHPYIVVQTPTGPMFSNQKFTK